MCMWLYECGPIVKLRWSLKQEMLGKNCANNNNNIQINFVCYYNRERTTNKHIQKGHAKWKLISFKETKTQLLCYSTTELLQLKINLVVNSNYYVINYILSSSWRVILMEIICIALTNT